MTGFAYIPIVMFVAMIASGGEGSGEAMMGGLFAFFTFPAVSVGAWFLYPKKTFRIAMFLVSFIGMIPIIATVIVYINDMRTPMPW